MKKLAILLLLPAIAFAQENFRFSTDDAEYQIVESSVSSKTTNGVLYIVALWEIKTPTNNWRWTTYTSGCDSPIGNIGIQIEGGFRQLSWSWDGGRAYDGLAAVSCLFYTAQKTKKPK